MWLSLVPLRMLKFEVRIYHISLNIEYLHLILNTTEHHLRHTNPRKISSDLHRARAGLPCCSWVYLFTVLSSLSSSQIGWTSATSYFSVPPWVCCLVCVLQKFNAFPRPSYTWLRSCWVIGFRFGL